MLFDPDKLPESLKSELFSAVASAVRQQSSLKECLDKLKEDCNPKMQAWNDDPRDPSDRGPSPLLEMMVEAQARLIFIHAVYLANAKHQIEAGSASSGFTWSKDAGMLESALITLNSVSVL